MKEKTLLQYYAILLAVFFVAADVFLRQYAVLHENWVQEFGVSKRFGKGNIFGFRRIIFLHKDLMRRSIKSERAGPLTKTLQKKSYQN